MWREAFPRRLFFWLLLTALFLSPVLLFQPTTAASERPSVIISRWEGTLDPTTRPNEKVSFTVTATDDGQPTMVSWQSFAVAAVFQDESHYTCFSGSDLHEVSFNTDFVLPLDPDWESWGFSGAIVPNSDYHDAGVGGQINYDYMSPAEARGGLDINYIYPDPDGNGTRIDGCSWIWHAYCVENCEGQGLFIFDKTEYKVYENVGTLEVVVRRVGGLDGTVMVDYVTSNGTAVAGSDYTPQSGTFTFADDITERTISIPIAVNPEVEGEETFSIVLSNASGGADVASPGTATVTIDDRPDFFMDPFTLDGYLTQSGNQFILDDLPFSVTNLVEDGPPSPATTVELKSGDTVIHTENVPALAPGAAHEFTADWDVTDLLVAGNGTADFTLTAKVDPANAIEEPYEFNNTRLVAGSGNVRPRLVMVDPQYGLDGYFYFDNESVVNPIAVTVDWNGDLSDETAVPGTVHYQLNGDETIVAGTPTGGSHSYDMGADFIVSESCANNTLFIHAETPYFTSDSVTIQPTVYPYPEWLLWAISNLDGADQSMETTVGAEIVEYKYDFRYPDPAFSAIWDVPDEIPWFGGNQIGVKESKVAVGLEMFSNGVGSGAASGESGLLLAGSEMNGTVDGDVELLYDCHEGVLFTAAGFGFSLGVPIEREMDLVDLFPGLSAAYHWPIVGRAIEWITDAASVTGTIEPTVAIDATWKDQGSGVLEFDSSTFRGEIPTGATLSVEPISGLSASIGGQGTPYVELQVPQNPNYLKKVGLSMIMEAMIDAYGYGGTFTSGFDCNYPGGCTISDRPATGTAVPFIRGSYRADRLAEPAANPGETILLSDIYPRPGPALAIPAHDERLLAYVHEDASDPIGRGGEIHILPYSGGGWQTAVAVTDDAQPDRGPALAVAGDGDAVLLWERATLAPGIRPTLDITFAQSVEIAASINDGGGWRAPTLLTSNSLMDHDLHVDAGTDGSVLALWRSHDGDDMLGAPGHTVDLNYALWDGNSWSGVQTAVAGQTNLLGIALTQQTVTSSTVVFSRIVDSVPVTTTNAATELYVSRRNGGGWSAPMRLTDNMVPDHSPVVAVDGNGDRHLLWLQSDRLLWLHNSWDPAQAQVVAAAEGGMLALELAVAANGNLAVTWQSARTGTADLTTLIYDAGSGLWSQPYPLTADTAREGETAAAFAPDGSLHLAYRKTEMIPVTRTLALSPTLAVTATDFLVAGRSDLATLQLTPGRDLWFDSLTLAPVNVAPGEMVTLTAVLRNQGGLTAVAPQVRLDVDGTELTTLTLPDLAGGAAYTVTHVGTMPETMTSHLLTATADPAAQLAETDESNNVISRTTTLPDLRVDRLYGVNGRSRLTVTAQVVNAGVVDTPAFAVTFYDGAPDAGSSLGTVTVPSLAAGGGVTVTLPLSLEMLQGLAGNEIGVGTDALAAVAELDETNNTAVMPFTPRPDLTLDVTDIHPDNGELVVTIRNQGVTTATDVLVWLHEGADLPTAGNADYMFTIDTLAAGETAVWALTHVGPITMALKIDPLNTIDETAEGNNAAVRSVVVPAASYEIYLPLLQRQ